MRHSLFFVFGVGILVLFWYVVCIGVDAFLVDCIYERFCYFHFFADLQLLDVDGLRSDVRGGRCGAWQLDLGTGRRIGNIGYLGIEFQ